MSLRDIHKNQKISADDIWSKRPGTGIPSRFMSKVIGKRAKKIYQEKHFNKKITNKFLI